MMMGGQTAEALIFGDITTGASNGLQNASRIARKMVTEFGMSAALGPRRFDTGQDMVFLGKELAQGHDYSDAVAEKNDAEIEDFLFKARAAAKEILTEHRSTLAALATRLLAEETVEGDDLHKMLVGESAIETAVAY